MSLSVYEAVDRHHPETLTEPQQMLEEDRQEVGGVGGWSEGRTGNM